jgi:hypothetical protein
MKKTNFDDYLKKKLADPTFAMRFQKAENAWDVALQIADAGLSQQKSDHRGLIHLTPRPYSVM